MIKLAHRTKPIFLGLLAVCLGVFAFQFSSFNSDSTKIDSTLAFEYNNLPSTITTDLPDGYEYPYTGKEIKPYLVVKDGEEELKLNIDYVATYVNNIEPGDAKINIEFIGSYSGSKTVLFLVTKAKAGYVDASIIGDYHEFTGSPIEPGVYIKYKDNVLIENTDYTVTYSNNVYVGQANALITFKGSHYEGTLNRGFEISQKNIAASAVITLPDGDTYNQTGVAVKPNISVTLNGEKLQQGVHYEVTYSDNVQAGQARATIKFIGNYSGVVYKEFNIVHRIDVAHILISVVMLAFIGFVLVRWLYFKKDTLDKMMGYACLSAVALTIIPIFFATSYLAWMSFVINAIVISAFVLFFIFKPKKKNF